MEMVVCYLFIYLIEAAIAKVYYAKIMKPKAENRRQWITLLLGYFFIFICSRAGSPWINFIVFFLVNIILIILLYNVNLLGALFHAIILTFTMLVMELLTEFIFGLVFGGFLIFMEQVWTFAIESVFIKLAYYFATQVLAFILRKKQIAMLTLEISNVIIILISLCLFWILITYIVICMMLPMENNMWIMVISSIVLVLVINVIIVWIVYYNQKKNQEYGQMQLQLQKEADNTLYYQMLYEQDENQKTLLHDMKWHISVIHDLCVEKDYGELERYVNRLLQKPEFKERVHICDHYMLNLILNRYSRQAERLGIAFYMDIRSHCLDFMWEQDITALFCNLLDNALESAKECENAWIELSAVQSQTGDITVISMKNACRREPMRNIKGSFVSHKRNAKLHGYGMKSITRITEQYDGSMEISYDETEEIFGILIMVRRIERNERSV